MLRLQHVVRILTLGIVLAGGIATACISDNTDDPTQTPVVIVPTSTSATEAGDTEPTSTDAPTATQTAPATATPEPSPTIEPTSTTPPTLPPSPTPTRAPISIPTPVPTPVSIGGVRIPDDLLSIMPLVEDMPAGMVLVDEGEADLALVAADFDDQEIREQQLTDWGFQGAMFREVVLPDDQIVDRASQPLAMISQGILLGSAEFAQQEMNSFFDGAVLTADPELNVQEIQIDPLGDATRAAIATTVGDDGVEVSLGVVGVTAGPFSFHFIALTGSQYDSIPDLITAAQVTLSYLGYTGVPAGGDILLDTDFSNWVSGETESGVLGFGEDGYYHVVVNQGGGSFISAYSTDHEPFTDVAVSVDMRYVSGDATSQGCVLTRVDQESQQFDYALCVDANGNVEVLFEQFDAEGNYSVEPLLPGGIVTVPPPVEWTTLTIITRGDEFWFLINGELIDSVRHTGPSGGAVGVIVNHYVETPEVPAEFVFTNLVVAAAS